MYWKKRVSFQPQASEQIQCPSLVSHDTFLRTDSVSLVVDSVQLEESQTVNLRLHPQNPYNEVKCLLSKHIVP